MHITRTIDYGYKTHRLVARIPCCKCGSKSTKSVTLGWNCFGDDVEEGKKLVAMREAEEARKDFVCNACQAASVNTDISIINISFDALKEKAIRAKEAEGDFNACAAALLKKGQIFLVKGDEYVVCSVFRGLVIPDAILVQGRKIHKKKPWILTGIYDNFPLDDIDIFTSNFIEERKANLD